MPKIGIVVGSYSPYHAGHDAVIRLASRENDIVHVYASLSNRKEISGVAKETVWKEHIEPSLPSNVNVTYGGSPIGNAWVELGEASLVESQDVYNVYSDPDDAESNFPDNMLQKYAPNLFNNGRVKRRPVERLSTVDISGTKMREFLVNNDKESFLKYVPRALDGNAVWNAYHSMMLVAKKPVKKNKKR